MQGIGVIVDQAIGALFAAAFIRAGVRPVRKFECLVNDTGSRYTVVLSIIARLPHFAPAHLWPDFGQLLSPAERRMAILRVLVLTCVPLPVQTGADTRTRGIFAAIEAPTQMSVSDLFLRCCNTVIDAPTLLYPVVRVDATEEVRCIEFHVHQQCQYESALPSGVFSTACILARDHPTCQRFHTGFDPQLVCLDCRQ